MLCAAPHPFVEVLLGPCGGSFLWHCVIFSVPFLWGLYSEEAHSVEELGIREVLAAVLLRHVEGEQHVPKLPMFQIVALWHIKLDDSLGGILKGLWHRGHITTMCHPVVKRYVLVSVA